MASDLEQRRRAIADALREIMAEPLPSRQLVVPAQHVPADEADVIDADDWDAAELTDGGDVIVPPMESAGSMSRMASLALFGHP